MPPPPLPAPPADPSLDGRLAANLAAVRRRIAAACERAGRRVDDVRIVAVTKTAGPETLRALARLGHRDVGENRVASLAEKHAALATELPGLRWHMIGHLQSNKVRRALPHVDVLHSGDGLALLERIDGEWERLGRGTPLTVLLQVNVSGEASKGGVPPDRVPDVLRRLRDLRHVRPAGLMTMAPPAADPESARPIFARLREMRDEACDRGYLEGQELSMGMTDDFDVAVEEGATLVRLGRILLAEHVVERSMNGSD